MAHLDRVYRKITRIGNSLGVTLTKDVLQKLHLAWGDDVEIFIKEDTGEMTLRKAVFAPQGLDAKFFETLTANVERYRQTINELKDR